MTETEWLTGRHPEKMIRWLTAPQRRKGEKRWPFPVRSSDERRLRLFACAVCSQIWEHMDRHESREAISIMERAADCEGVEPIEIARARRLASSAAYDVILNRQDPNDRIAIAARTAAMHTTHRSAREAAIEVSRAADDVATGHGRQLLEARFAAIFRDIVPNPWQRSDSNADCHACGGVRSRVRPRSGGKFAKWCRCRGPVLAWRTPEVMRLASGAYDDRPGGACSPIDQLTLIVLSDAIEEAGCTDIGLLEHLRSPGPHVRGCWALDIATGRL